MGAFTDRAQYANASEAYPLLFLVSKFPNLNLLGRDAVRTMQISLNTLLYTGAAVGKLDRQLLAIPRSDHIDRHLQQTYRDMCNELSVFFEPELECLGRVQPEIEFEQESVSCKPRSVPFAIQEELAQTYVAGIARGIWAPTSFSD